MPLYVVCPNECRIRMPINRTGRIVRCPECRSSIRIPVIPESRLKKGGQILCKAERVSARSATDGPGRGSDTPDVSSDTPDVPSDTSKRLPELKVLKPSNRNPPPPTHSAPPVPIQNPLKQESKKSNQHSPATGQGRHIDAELRRVDLLMPVVTSVELPLKIDIGDSVDSVQEASQVHDPRSWEERLEQANADRRILARFLAICLCLVAIMNMAPAIYYWLQLSHSQTMPRWIYIQVFVGAVHLVYAFFLAQIPDWSAMRAISIAMLVAAFGYGLVSTGLLVGGQGSLVAFLAIPFSLSRQALIWCVAMLCVSTLMSYWSGKESTNWQRAEELLKDILSKSVGNKS